MDNYQFNEIIFIKDEEELNELWFGLLDVIDSIDRMSDIIFHAYGYSDKLFKKAGFLC